MSRSLDAARRAEPGFDAEPCGLGRRRRAAERLRRDPRPGVLSAAARRGACRRRRRVGHARGVHAARLPRHARSHASRIDGYDTGEAKTWPSCPTRSGPTTSARCAFLSSPAVRSRIATTRQAAPVIVVNNTLAQRFWGGAANALDKRIRVADGEWRTIDRRRRRCEVPRAINEAPRPYFYLPFLQSYRSSMMLHTRGPGPSRCWSTRRGRELPRSTAICRSSIAQADGRADAGALIFFRLTGDDAVPVRLGRNGARRARHLRAGVVHGQAEHARNRHPHGARRLWQCQSSGISRHAACGSAQSAWCSARSGRSAATRMLGNVLFGVSPDRRDVVCTGARHRLRRGYRRHHDSRMARGTDESVERTAASVRGAHMDTTAGQHPQQIALERRLRLWPG